MEKDYPGCRNALRKAFELRGVPIEAIDIMISSLMESSIKQYNSCLKKWWKYCKNDNVNSYKGTITEILKFLMKEFQSNKASYGTLNSCRSAIALLQDPEVGENARVKKFFREIKNCGLVDRNMISLGIQRLS